MIRPIRVRSPSQGESRHLAEVRRAVERVRASCDIDARRAADPVQFVHQYAARGDQELVALVAACVAFGNAKVIVAKLRDLFSRLSPSPVAASDDVEDLNRRLRGWKHRVFVGGDIAWLLSGARHLQRSHGTLEAVFQSSALDGTARSLRECLTAFVDALREASDARIPRAGRGTRHLLPDPRQASGCKRLLLFLRWMGRPADGVDLGLWNIDPARLLIPVDVHLHRLARNLGFTARRAVTWETAEDVTRALARFDPADPTKYDFALCHLGMLKRCPSAHDVGLCAGCGIKSVCVHWRK